MYYWQACLLLHFLCVFVVCWCSDDLGRFRNQLSELAGLISGTVSFIRKASIIFLTTVNIWILCACVCHTWVTGSWSYQKPRDREVGTRPSPSELRCDLTDLRCCQSLPEEGRKGGRWDKHMERNSKGRKSIFPPKSSQCTESLFKHSVWLNLQFGQWSWDRCLPNLLPCSSFLCESREDHLYGRRAADSWKNQKHSQWIWFLVLMNVNTKRQKSFINRDEVYHLLC